MILTLFIVFIIIGLILIGLGIFNDDMLVLAVAGCGILFILGGVLLLGNVTYQTGENITTNYYYINNSTSIDNTTELKEYNYISFSDDNSHWFGFILIASGILGFVGVMMQTRGGYKPE
jgi:hypothetical protein